MKKVYLSGKIGGLHYETYLANFDKAETEVREMGLVPVNPIFNGLYESAPYWLHLVVDLIILLPCGYIYMQSNWRKSLSAKILHTCSKVLKKKILYQS